MEDYSSDSSSSSWRWIRWFLSCKGNEFFCEVDEEFIEDRFNLTGLNLHVSHYYQALELILHGFEHCVSEESQMAIESSARHLYGLIHARFILTSAGMNKMLHKYKCGDFGKCPRVLCRDQNLLPIGLTDQPRRKPVKLFCLNCEDVYTPKSQRHNGIDGAYFGISFPYMLLMQFPSCKPAPSKDRYHPKIYGFKIHASEELFREQDKVRVEMENQVEKFSGK